MEEALEEGAGLFPADAQSAVVLEPRDGPFDRPATLVATQAPPVLRRALRPAVGAVRRDHKSCVAGQLIVEFVAVVGLVADESLGRVGGEDEVKQALHQLGFVRRGRGGVDRHRQTVRIDKHHDFHAFSGLGQAHAIAATFGLAEGRVDEALVEPVLPAVLKEPSRVAHDRLKHAGSDPSTEPSVNGTLRTEAPR